MKHTLTVKIPVYNFDCVIIFANNITEEVDRQRKKQKLSPLEGTVYGYAMSGDNVHKYYLFYGLEKLNVRTLTHEISHLVDFVFQDRDIEPPTGEPRAYLTGHISEKIFEFVFKKKLLQHKWLNNDEQVKQTTKEK